MRFNKFITRKRERDTPELQLIPFIDILFVLLVFFMITTNFTNLSSGINVKLPKSEVKEVTPDSEVVVSITKEKTLFVNSKRVDSVSFESEVAKQLEEKGKTNVIIRADEGLEYKHVVKVISMAKNAGASEVDIATDEEKAGE